MNPRQKEVFVAVRDAVGGVLNQAAGVERFGARFTQTVRRLAAQGVLEWFADVSSADADGPGVASWRVTAAGRKMRVQLTVHRTPVAHAEVQEAPRVVARPRVTGERQRRGGGSISKTKDGRHRVRAPDGSRSHLGFYPTREEAEDVLEAARRALATSGPPVGEVTIAEYGRRVLDERELAGYRGVYVERRCFTKHVEASDVGRMPLATVTTRDVRDFVKRMSKQPADDKRGDGPRTLSRHTVKRALTIISAILAASVEADIRDDNPAIGVRVKKVAGLAETREKWAYLTSDEQRLVMAGPIPEPEKLLILFALGTGMRAGELFNLELRDLHVSDDAQGGPHVIVRFGSKGKPPKNGKVRRIPLVPVALDAARRWLEVLPSYVVGKHGEVRNAAGLVWPGPRGSRRYRFGTYGALDRLLQACGVTKHLRFHDLRHTCASSLVGGFWGRAWNLQETCAMLGHSSIMVTERYAHLGGTFLTKAAAETGRLNPAPTAPSMSLEEARRIVAAADREAARVVSPDNLIDLADRTASAAISAPNARLEGSG